MKKRIFHKLTKVEQALVYIADMIEDPNHDQYKIKQVVLDLLGLELIEDK